LSHIKRRGWLSSRFIYAWGHGWLGMFLNQLIYALGVSCCAPRLRERWPPNLSPNSAALNDLHGYFPDDIIYNVAGVVYSAHTPWGSANYDLYVFGDSFRVRIGNIPIDVCKSFASRLAGVFAREPHVTTTPASGGWVLTDGDGMYNISPPGAADIGCDLDSSDGLTVPIMLYLTR